MSFPGFTCFSFPSWDPAPMRDNNLFHTSQDAHSTATSNTNTIPYGISTNPNVATRSSHPTQPLPDFLSPQDPTNANTFQSQNPFDTFSHTQPSLPDMNKSSPSLPTHRSTTFPFSTSPFSPQGGSPPQFTHHHATAEIAQAFQQFATSNTALQNTLQNQNQLLQQTLQQQNAILHAFTNSPRTTNQNVQSTINPLHIQRKNSCASAKCARILA